MLLIEKRKKEMIEINQKIKDLQKKRKFLENYILVTEYRAKKRLEKKKI